MLGTVGWLLLMLAPGALGINALASAVVYAAIRIGKRGKAPGDSQDFYRYAVSRRAFLSAATPDRDGRRHVFCPRPRPYQARSHLGGSLSSSSARRQSTLEEKSSAQAGDTECSDDRRPHISRL